MRHIFAAIALAMPEIAAASIPVSIAVKVASPDIETEARTLALVQLLSSHDNFLLSTSNIARGAALQCLETPDIDRCARTLVRGTSNPARTPSVLVLATPAGGDKVAIRCIGSGKVPPVHARQHVTLDLKRALFGSLHQRKTLRRAAVDCIWSAGAEDDSVIKRN